MMSQHMTCNSTNHNPMCNILQFSIYLIRCGKDFAENALNQRAQNLLRNLSGPMKRSPGATG
ncbi:hypothetical protein T09_14361 [Trichinella sp. T9]|nr:hypothetical protein T09_14361 [Trichinella sp. T9]